MPTPENPDAKPYVKTIAGIKGANGLVDGQPSEAQFSRPFGIAVDANQNILVADFQNNVIRRINFVKYTKYFWDCLRLVKASIGQNCLKHTIRISQQDLAVSKEIVSVRCLNLYKLL